MATDIRFEVATLRHVHLVASRMRAADRAEVWASGNHRPAGALRRSIAASTVARTLFIKAEAACMFGVVVDGPAAIPWALTTDTVDRYPVTFFRASKHVIAELRGRFPLLVQMVDARYSQALRWTERLGFRLGDSEPFGAEGLPFRPIFLGGANV